MKNTRFLCLESRSAELEFVALHLLRGLVKRDPDLIRTARLDRSIGEIHLMVEKRMYQLDLAETRGEYLGSESYAACVRCLVDNWAAALWSKTRDDETAMAYLLKIADLFDKKFSHFEAVADFRSIFIESFFREFPEHLADSMQDPDFIRAMHCIFPNGLNKSAIMFLPGRKAIGIPQLSLIHSSQSRQNEARSWHMARAYAP